MHADKLTHGRARLVRHRHLLEREIMTGIGPVAVRCPRVRDRVGEGSDRIRFSSAILPYARRSKSLEALIPILYLRLPDQPSALSARQATDQTLQAAQAFRAADDVHCGPPAASSRHLMHVTDLSEPTVARSADWS